MRGTLEHAMDAGLVVSFTSNERTQQEVFLDWQSPVLPQAGDVVSCVEEDAEGRVARRLTGTVVGPRRVEIRRDAQGQVSVWVRLVAEETCREVVHSGSNGRAKKSRNRLVHHRAVTSLA